MAISSGHRRRNPGSEACRALRPGVRMNCEFATPDRTRHLLPVQGRTLFTIGKAQCAFKALSATAQASPNGQFTRPSHHEAGVLAVGLRRLPLSLLVRLLFVFGLLFFGLSFLSAKPAFLPEPERRLGGL